MKHYILILISILISSILGQDKFDIQLHGLPREDTVWIKMDLKFDMQKRILGRQHFGIFPYWLDYDLLQIIGNNKGEKIEFTFGKLARFEKIKSDIIVTDRVTEILPLLRGKKYSDHKIMNGKYCIAMKINTSKFKEIAKINVESNNLCFEIDGNK